MRLHCKLLACLFVLSAASSHAQQMDMQAMMKWSQAQFINYHVVGVHEGKASLSSTGMGFADVMDRVVIDFLWDLTSGLVGEANFQNTATSTSNLRDFEPQCLPPLLKGPFEFYDVQKIERGATMTLVLTVKTTRPVVEVAQSCTASRRAEPAKTSERPEELPVPSPVTLAMGAPDTNDLQFLQKSQQIVYRKGGWVWTFTPTIAKK